MFSSDETMWFGEGVMWLLWIMLVICIVLLLKAMLRSLSRLNKNDDNYMTILKKRYAQGEIDSKEYQQLKKELEQD